jgi:precorrin-6B methylase 2
MDIFADVLRKNHDLLLSAVIRAAHQLGVFEILGDIDGDEPHTTDNIAARLGLPQYRLNRLLDVLVAEGSLVRSIEHDRKILRLITVPDHTDTSAGEWDMMAEVVSSDKPMALHPDSLRDHLTYVASKGAVAAPILWNALQPKSGARLLDVGGGLGAYSVAFLNYELRNNATLVDLPEVLRLLDETGVRSHPRLEASAADARDCLPTEEYDVVLLANLLHLFGPADCQRIVQKAVSAAVPGGSVVIKDVLISPSRTGPPVGLYFALNMALYTECGDVHSVPQLTAYMSEAGLVDIHEIELSELPDSVTVVGVRA